MEKRSKKRSRKDSVSINTIYETIKDKGFMQELWVDMISDVKNKPSYLNMKEMVQKVIESSIDEYPTQPKDHNERIKTRTIFTNLSIMTYTIDTLICELLRKKLKEDYKTIISNIVDEFRNKKQSSNSQENNNSVQMLEGIGEMLSKEATKKSTNQTESAKVSENDQNSSCGPVDVSFIKRESCSSPGEDEHSVDFPDTNTIAFSIVETESMNNTNNTFRNASTNLMSCLPSPKKVHTKKRKTKKRGGRKSKALPSEENSEVDIVNVSDGALSDDSTFSFRSASSVHTSDLSSFEDTVSISSEDEQGFKITRHVPLKQAYEVCVNGNIDELHKNSLKKNNATHSSCSSTPVNSSGESPKRLPSRIRKPNSKYSSEDVICSVKSISSKVDSSPSVHSNISEKYDMKRNSIISHADSPKRRGRPPKNIETEGNAMNGKLSNHDQRTNGDVSLPSTLTSSQGAEISRKRGRPPKNAIKISKNDKNKNFHSTSSSSEDERQPKRAMKTVPSTNTKPKSSNSSEPAVKKRRGRPPSTANKIVPNSDSFKHTVESFTNLEERLSVKDPVPLSPTKSSQKYDTSDLYKPRSDFRGCFDRKGNSRAITLFSN